MILKKLVHLTGSLLVIVVLSGCMHKQHTYQYFMLHPEYLQGVYNRCVSEIADPALPCEIIMRAQADFTLLSNQHDQQPETFGGQIMEMEVDRVLQESKYNMAMQEYLRVGTSNPSLEEMKNARIEVDKTRAAYELSVDREQILLKVVAATSSI